MATGGKEIYICRKGGNYERVINLMLISSDKRNHYVTIKSLSRLLANKNTKSKVKQHFCMNCLQGFEREITRDEHRNYCSDNESVKVEMPHKNSRVEFCDGQFQFKVPFVMYADFESLLEPIHGPENDPRASSSMRGINNHVPSGWCVYSEFAYGKVENPLKLYRGEDCVKKFCDHVIGEVYRLYHSFPEKPMNPLTPKEIDRYKRAKRCHICFKPFTGDNPSIRDHCDCSGNYRGATHRNCNLRYQIPHYIPIVFHNLLGYDAHLFIRELAASVPGRAKMGVIAKNKEDYITFSIKIVDKHIDKNGVERDKEIELRFIDSFKFMSSSLDSLTNNLVCRGQKLFGFEEYTPKQYELLVKKGIYPYEYMSEWKNLKKPNFLLKKRSIVNLIWRGSKTKIMNM